jgi:hypothetical protein
MTLTPADRVMAHPSVIGRDLDGETVLLDLHSGVYYGLDPIGTRVWNLLMDHHTVEQVYAIMADEYDVDPEALRRDVLALVGELCERGLAVREAAAS